MHQDQRTAESESSEGSARNRASPEASALANEVRAGLARTPKRLPPWLFYDAEGSRLFEQITALPEYYLTRTEAGILERYAGELVDTALALAGPGAAVVELGAGSSVKTELLLSALVAREGRALYLPIDVSLAALEAAAARLSQDLPAVTVRPLLGRSGPALAKARAAAPALWALFLGSSIGNSDDAEAVALLAELRAGLPRGSPLLLGADRKKPLSLLLPAYDDAQGVTAAFNRNLLVRLNRDLDADFVPARFRHVAVWNEQAGAVEMHLESRQHQRIWLRGLGLEVTFEAGERLHTESSNKYDDARLDRIFAAAGWSRVRDWLDSKGWFGLHLLRSL